MAGKASDQPEKSGSILDIKDLPGDIVDAVDNTVVALGRTVYLIPSLAKAIIRLIDATPYIALVSVTAVGVWWIRKGPTVTI